MYQIFENIHWMIFCIISLTRPPLSDTYAEQSRPAIVIRMKVSIDHLYVHIRHTSTDSPWREILYGNFFSNEKMHITNRFAPPPRILFGYTTERYRSFHNYSRLAFSEQLPKLTLRKKNHPTNSHFSEPIYVYIIYILSSAHCVGLCVNHFFHTVPPREVKIKSD